MPFESAANNIVGLLLAAGTGQRFGGDKSLYPLRDGTPIAVAAAHHLMPACARVAAVVRPDHLQLAHLLKKTGCEIVFCPDAEKGMGHSLSAGVDATRDAAGWIVALADMPFIATSSHIAAVSCLQSGASIVATEYRGRRGHPVGFSRAWFAELSTLTGDHGGRSILEKNREQLVLCPVDDRGVIVDIDRREDLERF